MYFPPHCEENSQPIRFALLVMCQQPLLLHKTMTWWHLVDIERLLFLCLILELRLHVLFFDPLNYRIFVLLVKYSSIFYYYSSLF